MKKFSKIYESKVGIDGDTLTLILNDFKDEGFNVRTNHFFFPSKNGNKGALPTKKFPAFSEGFFHAVDINIYGELDVQAFELLSQALKRMEHEFGKDIRVTVQGSIGIRICGELQVTTEHDCPEWVQFWKELNEFDAVIYWDERGISIHELDDDEFYKLLKWFESFEGYSETEGMLHFTNHKSGKKAGVQISETGAGGFYIKVSVANIDVMKKLLGI